MKPWLLLFFTALFIRLAAVFFWQFDGLYGQDAYAYWQQAVAITQTLPHSHPPPTNFFWPNGYPLLVAIWMFILGQMAWAGQLPTLLCGAALSPLVFFLSHDLFFKDDNQLVMRSSHTDLIAGLLVAVAGQAVLSSIVIMADIPALFWATLAAWLVVRAVKVKQRSRGAGEQGRIFTPAVFFLAAGVALALAIISRWLYVLIAPAMIFFVIFRYWQAGQIKKLYWQPLGAVFSGALILAPQLWLSLNKPEGLAHSWLLGWSPANFFQREFENIDGHFLYALPNFIFYAQPAGHPAYIFPLLGVAALWAVWRLGQTRQWAALILLLGWAIPVYLFLAGIPYQNFRFGLTLYLPLVVLTGYGLSDLYSHVTLRRSRRIPAALLEADTSPVHKRTWLETIFGAAIVLSLLGMLFWAYPMLDSFLKVQNQSKIIAAQVEQSVPENATLITFGLTLTVQHYTRLNTLEFFYQDESSLQTLTESPGPLYLLLDLNSIKTQWRGKTPEINYQWLKQNTTLTEIGRFPPYTLFKVIK